MPKYTAIPVQTVESEKNVLLTDAIRCNRGYVMHDNGSGVVTLRGITNQCFARYRVSFGGNIAIPAGGTVAPISIAIAAEGEPRGGATAIVTPAAPEQFDNVFVADLIDVPRGCCVSISVKNISNQAIEVENGNLIIERIA